MIKKIKNICVDCDDVLVDFHTPLKEWYNATYGVSLKLENYTTYLFNLVWGVTPKEGIDRVKKFHYSEYSKRIFPIEGAVEAIDVLFQKGKRLFMATSRSKSFLREDTEDLLKKYFKDKFLDIFYCSNNYSKAKNSGKSKGDVCKILNASLVDDSLDYAKQVACVGLRAILFGSYPWNRNGILPEGILRGVNWKKTLEILI